MPTDPIPGVAAFHDQFLLSAAPLEPPAGWQTLAAAGWHLLAHPALPVARLRTADGVEAGFAVGHLIDRGGRLARRQIALPFAAAQAGAAEVERYLYGFGGRFAAIVLLPGFERVYVDSLASLATVWCGERRRVASTTSLLLHDEPGHPLFRRGPREFPGNRPNQFFPADPTAAPGVRRLLPNHRLDLATWSAARHHPAAPYEEAARAEIPGLVATFHQVVRRQVGAAIEECGGGYLALTAGYDSRRLLACARDFVDRLECVTLHGRAGRRDRGNDVDVHVASALAARAGFRHRLLPVARVPPEVAGDYLRRIGYAGGAGKAAKFFMPPLHRLDLTRLWMTGHGGGRCRGRHVHRPSADGRATAERILEVLRLPQGRGFREAVERWLEGAPGGSPGFHLELAFVELQVGGWASPHLYGTAPFRANLLPLTHREAIDAVLGVPASYRAAGDFDRDLFRLAWPELLDLPFNDYGGLRRWADRGRSVLSLASRGLRRAGITPRP